jgi:DNA polymerase-1
MQISSEILDLDVFLAADASQMELRALAEISNDKLLIQQFQEAAKDRGNPFKDIHCLVGHTLTGWPVERIAHDKKTRRVVKNTQFGIVFGLNEDNLYPYIVAKMRAVDGPKADLTGITPQRCAELHRAYFRRYKGVARFHKTAREQAEKDGFVETLFGFRRDIDRDASGGTYWGNQAINTPVQGTAHQFMLIALALLDLKRKTYNLLQRCIMEVHDALYFRVKLRDLVEAHRQLIQLFEHGTYEYAQEKFKLKLRVPLLVEASAGFTKGSMVEDYKGGPIKEFLVEWRKKQKAVDSKSWEDLLPNVA